MLYSSTSLRLPPYSSLKQHEGKGNYAIERYYKWPYRFFYRKKLKMIVDLMEQRVYHNILDFGSGPGIFEKELKRHALFVKKFDRDDVIDPRWRFDAIVCASYLEFSDLQSTIIILKNLLKPGGKLYVGSPMQSFLTNSYFKLIKDHNNRHHHMKIISAISKGFKIEKYITWMNLYFALRASRN